MSDKCIQFLQTSMKAAKWTVTQPAITCTKSKEIMLWAWQLAEKISIAAVFSGLSMSFQHYFFWLCTSNCRLGNWIKLHFQSWQKLVYTLNFRIIEVEQLLVWDKRLNQHKLITTTPLSRCENVATPHGQD